MTRRTQLAFLAALAAGALLRFSSLTARPLHHDEGVNSLFLLHFIRNGSYRYDPTNYHGPLLYYMVAPLLSSFGLHSVLLRLWPAAIGTMTIAVFWSLRRTIGGWGAVTAAWLVALSPISVYFSRDLIHEAWLVGTAALGVGSLMRSAAGRPSWVVVAWSAVALMFATKETTPILLAALGAGFLGAGLVTRGRTLVREVRNDLARTWSAHLWGVLVASFLLVLLFTSFLTHPGHLADFFRAYAFWTKTGVQGSGHEKPWPYFFTMLWRYERIALTLGIGGFVLAALRREAAVGIGIAAALLLAVQAAIPYKTPWLALSFVPLLAASAGYLIDRAASELKDLLPRAMLTAMLGAGLLRLGLEAHRVSYVAYDDDRETFVYSQTKRDFLGLVAAIEAVVATNPEGTAVTLAVRSIDHFPLNWYVRDCTSASYQEKVEGEIHEGLAVVKSDDLEQARALATRPYRTHGFTLRPGVELTLLIAEDLFTLASPRIAKADAWQRLEPPALRELAAVISDLPLEEGLIVRSYAAADFDSTPIKVEVGRAPRLEIDDGANSEWSGHHGMQWTGLLKAPVDGPYRFVLSSDDGSRLELNDSLVVDNWGQHADRVRSATVVLRAGLHRVRLSYIDYGGGARLSWTWRPPGATSEVELPPAALVHESQLNEIP